MIQLTRLNNEVFTLNAIMIEQIQSHPDTTITLINGKKMVVKEPEKEVASLVTSYYRKLGIRECVKGIGDANG
ncbi:flagellar FlbD family protein [Virgibacillus necropolis]|uniref:Flagellar protein FlbD n=1 Tax=Virgibacillus necropolis TaxID=163877 RepID=A0A221MDP1_9BACI|nr:flagellar FlbD family protein [Virgibacillus necropolis]ASN05720.1 flagellar protein FlbD [Virgibacillus necropolis]